MSFIKTFTFEERLNKSKIIILKYPHLIPLILEKFTKIKDENTNEDHINNENKLFRNKFLVKKNEKFEVIIFSLRKSLNIDKSKALFFYCNNKIINKNDIIQDLYHKYKNEDGFLYINFEYENTFG